MEDLYRRCNKKILTDSKVKEETDRKENLKISEINLWETLKLNTMFTSFHNVNGRNTTRKARQEYCYKRFKSYFGNDVLDVGCDDGIIRELHQGNYIGVDLYGSPEIIVDFDHENLPFMDNKFDTVICSEVLEHVDELHRLFSELVRVTKNEGIVIISLPNCWRQTMGNIMTGNSEQIEYGLPEVKPRDRHKWFFSSKDALAFVEKQTLNYDIDLIEIENVTNH